MSNRNYKFETLQLHVGQEQPDPATDARAVPIYQTTSYVFRNSEHAAARFGLADAGNIYGRLTNSTQGVFEDRIAKLEGGVAGLAVASGAAAITYTIQALAGAGEHIVAQKTIYGGTSNLLAHTLPNYGITATFVDAHNLEEVEGAIQDNTKAIYLETLGNPNSDIPDIDAIAEIAHKHGLPVVVDNTFGTPYLIRPIEHGADIVVHSATKFIGGHGNHLVALSLMAVHLTGLQVADILEFQSQTQAIMELSLQRQQVLQHLQHISEQFYLEIQVQQFHHLMLSYYFREQKHYLLELSVIMKIQRR